MARRPRTPWSPEDEREARAMYEAGKTIRDIAEWLGRADGSVHAMLKRIGVTFRAPNRRRIPDPEIARAVDLYAGGLSMEEVAQALGRSSSSLDAAFRRRNIPTRNRREAAMLRRKAAQ